MRAIVSAGGTGGHIYPALAIINKIKECEPNSEFLYIGTHNRMEKDIIPKYNIPFKSIEIYGFNRRNLLKNFKTIKCLIKAKKDCKKMIKEFNPDVVIGVGGYVTVPVITSASKLGYKTFIHEQNSIPGLSNKFLSRYADIVGVSLPGSVKYFPKNKTSYTGNPRSEEVINTEVMDKKEYNLSKNKKLVVIVMGSLGSTTMNNKLHELVKDFKDKDYEVLLVTGKNYYDDYKKLDIPDNVKVVPYLDKMLSVMKGTDLIVSRAGASTVAEITALGLPSIIVPSPYVTHNHQLKNALELESAGACKVLEEKDFSSETLLPMIDKILEDKKLYKSMHESSLKLGIPDSATRIYDLIKKVVD